MSTATFNFRLGINPLSWSNDDLPSLGGETPLDTALSEGREIGYEGFELGVKFPREPEKLRAVLASHGLALAAGWYSGELAHRSVRDEIAAAGPFIELLTKNGSSTMNYGEVAGSIQGLPIPLYKRPRFRTTTEWKEYASRIDEFARYTLDQGVRLAYHHHMGAYIQSPEDIDRLMELTGDDVGLLFDAGHITFGGGDPSTVMERYAARVAHVHLKDVRPAVLRLARNGSWGFLQSVLNGVFTVPGDGAIDFAPLIARLSRENYDGWLVVEAEQDPAVAPSYAMAEKGFLTVSGIINNLLVEVAVA